MNDPSQTRSHGELFEVQAARPAPGLLRELLAFLRANRKWWLVPIIVFLLLVGALVVLSGTGAAPLLYTLF